MIVGNNVDEKVNGYKEGHGSEAEFSLISSFTTFTNGLRVIAVDSRNNVFRVVERKTKKTFLLAGRPGSSLNEVRNGDFKSSRFFGLWDIATRDGVTFYSSESVTNYIRVLDSSSKRGYVSHLSLPIQQPFGLLFDNQNVFLYISQASKISKINLENSEFTKVSGSSARNGKKSSYADGPIANATFNNLHGMVFVDNNTLLAADTGNNRLRVVDLTENVTSICIGSSSRVMETDETIDECTIRLPFSVFQHNDSTVLIGTEDGIRSLTGRTYL